MWNTEAFCLTLAHLSRQWIQFWCFSNLTCTYVWLLLVLWAKKFSVCSKSLYSKCLSITKAILTKKFEHIFSLIWIGNFGKLLPICIYTYVSLSGTIIKYIFNSFLFSKHSAPLLIITPWGGDQKSEYAVGILCHREDKYDIP